MLQDLDYDCLPPTHPIFLDGFELGDTSAWSDQKSCPGPMNPNSCFSFAIVQFTVHFNNESTGDQPLSHLWDFGDGSLTSTLENPSHDYAAPGNYNVKLTVINTLGADTIIKPVTVDF
jgi:serine protease